MATPDEDDPPTSRPELDLAERALSVPPGEREAFVRREARGDEERVAQALRILREADAADAALGHLRDEGAERATQIGPYRILDVLGEGGMGTVYLAEQQQPVRRRVALKLIKLGMDSRSVVARFEHERQALALMQHDGIARVYDCGTSERGQPYFVMELVKGVPLTDYCDQHKLSLPARLQLMQQICAAVTHAHQKGIVHRDLKPDNVLVCEEQGRVQPKIIDFGLAKALGSRLVDATVHTEIGRLVGTFEYMAPEQAELGNLDVDTRADVYSLGVMLYEILTGQLPFPSRQLRDVGVFEMQRVLREVDPPKPSTRVSTADQTASAIAARRGTTAQALHRALKSDLDWVVLKALEKDRTRRYDSAADLAADLQRYLDDQPLLAGPPSAAYRLLKFVRRHRRHVAAALAVLLALVAGLIATTVQYRRAEQEAADNARLAAETAALAAAESDARATAQRTATELAATVRNFRQLAAVLAYGQAMAGEATLYPAWPDELPAIERWLPEADRVLAKEPELRETLAELRRQALPATAEELAAERRSHPRFAAYERQQQLVASLRRANAIRSGAAALAPVTLTPAERALGVHALRQFVWDRVSPNAADRRVWDDEARGLAAARLMVEQAQQDTFLDTLAWALLANGQDAEAQQRMAEAVAATDRAGMGLYVARQRELAAAIADAPELLARAEHGLTELEREVGERRAFRFPPSDEGEAARFLHDALAKLLDGLPALRAARADVEQRRDWARRIRDLTLAHPRAAVGWAAVREQLRTNPIYADHRIELRDEDLLGLVPLGPNPATGYLEFYHLRSAWDGAADPAGIEIPRHRPDGSIEVTEATGIVFVLLPGAKFVMGAQRNDPAGPVYDPGAEPTEEPHAVTLGPFFVARHELTQAQWARLWHGDPARRRPSRYAAGTNDYIGGVIATCNPVEQVTWTECDALLRSYGLALPTEAQWEYACRAGTTTPWYVPKEQLGRCANVADQTCKDRGVPYACEQWRDGHNVHAPVGSFAPNAFGLYDMHGNVWEWCRDWYGNYGDERPGDGLRPDAADNVGRVVRGGGHRQLAVDARSANRSRAAPTTGGSTNGVRAARALRP